MVKKRPKTTKDLLSISGVGESRLKQYGEAFLNLFMSEQTKEALYVGSAVILKGLLDLPS